MPRRRKTPGPTARGGYQGSGNAGGAQTPTAPTGMRYGEHKASIDAQRAVPVPDMQPDLHAQAAQDALTMPAPAAGGLLAPTTRPGEPVTAGIPSGPGPGPEAVAGTTNMGGSVLNELRIVYRLYPTEEVRQIIERLEGQNAVR